MSLGRTRLQVRIRYSLWIRSIVSFTAPALVYGPKYLFLSFFMVRENCTRGKSSPTVTLIYG